MKEMVKQVKDEVNKLRELKSCENASERDIIDRIDSLSGHILEEL